MVVRRTVTAASQVKVARRNQLHAESLGFVRSFSPQAGETAAKLFTLTKTCTRHRIDPYAYLQDVYARLPTLPPDELPTLLPDNWIKAHPQHLIQERVQESLDRARRTRERRAARRAAA